MDIRKIKKLIEMLEESNLGEIEIREGEESIRISRASSAPVTVPAAAAPGPAPAAPVIPQAEDQTTPPGHVVVSPMVGTFYAASSPEALPFVKVGQHVHVGMVVCIVEAMKVFNEIKSEVAGTLERIAAKNSEPVEFGQPLFYPNSDVTRGP
jgi:acetyl-CoA carboxylase biotin carboxyl carrier protein